MSASLADQLEIWGFEKDFSIFADGSIGFGLECKPVDVSTWSDEGLNVYSEKVSQFLNGLDPHLDVQFIQDIVPGNDIIIAAHRELANNATNDIAKQLCESRVQYLSIEDQNGYLPSHQLKIFVRKPFTQELSPKSKIFSKDKKFQEISQQRLEKEIEHISRIQQNLIQSLGLLGIEAKILLSDDIAKLLYNQWNPSRRVDFNTYNPEEIRESVLFSDVGIDVSGFVIGSTFFRTLSLKTLPDQTYSAMASKLRELPFKSRLLVTVHVPDQMKEIESLKTQRRVAFSLVVGKKSGVADLESTAKLQDLESLLEQMIAQGQKVFHVSVTVVLQSENEASLDSDVDQVISKFRELGGAELITETLAAFDVFSESAIPNSRAKERIRKIKTSNLCDLIPVYGPWEGHKSPSVLLRSRAGSLFKFSPFDESISNANQLISGGSGSGKSFLTNLLLLQMLKENPKVFFIDIGGSYKKLTENLNGQYVDFSVDENFAVNPFDLGPNELVPSSQKIKFLLGLVEVMTKEENRERVPKLAQAEIEEAIQQVYRTSKNPTLSDLKIMLLNHPDIEIKKYGKILSTWCGSTPYGKFLDRPTSVEFAKDIVAFDLKGLESYPDLQAVCLYIITDLVWREVQRDRSQMKFIVFDECWKLLKDEGGLAFIEEVFRTVRKYFCSAIAISQDLLDFLNSKISSALLPNCSIKWILMQNQSDFSKMKEALGLNDNESALIGSLYQKKGELSEVFLISGPEKRAVVSIEPTPLELWLATTDPRDLALIQKTKSENPSLSQFECLKKLSEQFPNGAKVV